MHMGVHAFADPVDKRHRATAQCCVVSCCCTRAAPTDDRATRRLRTTRVSRTHVWRLCAPIRAMASTRRTPGLSKKFTQIV